MEVLEWGYYGSVRVGLLRKCYSGILTEVLQCDCYESVTVRLSRKC
jgi:hypothetical protein